MAQFSLEHFTIKKLEKIQILFKDNVTQGSSLTLKPANFYNIEKHIKHTSILKVNYACCVHITDYGLIPYQRILALFIHIMKAYIINYKKVCYTKNPFLMKP